MNSPWVVREFIGGPFDGEFIEGAGSPPPWSHIVDNDNPGVIIGSYILVAWVLPVATYEWRPSGIV